MMKRLTEGLAWVKRLEDERGGALIELALCLPILCIPGLWSHRVFADHFRQSSDVWLIQARLRPRFPRSDPGNHGVVTRYSGWIIEYRHAGKDHRD